MYHTMPKAWYGTPIYANNKFRKEMIDRFDFKFESRYIGLWYQPNNPNKKYKVFIVDGTICSEEL